MVSMGHLGEALDILEHAQELQLEATGHKAPGDSEVTGHSPLYFYL